MKYMSVWHIRPENQKAAVDRFLNDPPAMPDGITMLGRWHEVGTGRGFALIETDDPVAMSKYLLAWADVVDQKVQPVVDDEQIGAALMG